VVAVETLEMSGINQFLSGGIMIGYLSASFFFLRFWKRQRDILFALFSAAFAVLAIERTVLLATEAQEEIQPYIYLIRFTAFMLILFGFYLKNRKS
jgi:hypothetical protein